MEMKERSIKELVSENYVFASTLHFFGISFYDYNDDSLEQVCKNKGLDLTIVINNLESVGEKAIPSTAFLNDLPVDLIIAYLRHYHHLFVKQRLPFIASLINGLNETEYSEQMSKNVRDLKFVFPLFVYDFIEHIYEEEDTLFNYVLELNKVNESNVNFQNLLKLTNEFSIKDFALDHDTHDDELHGIREFTNNYTWEADFGLHLKVVFGELKRFEQDLRLHAQIENEIFFPKSLKLELEAKKFIASKTVSN